jgi:hypothetical protein
MAQAQAQAPFEFTLPALPNADNDDFGNIPNEIQTLLVELDDADADITTVDNANMLARLLPAGHGMNVGVGVGAGTSVIDVFATYIASVLGFQPVPQRARRLQPNGEIDTENGSYVAELLFWGAANREAFKRILYAVFNQYADTLHDNVTTVIENTGFIGIDVTRRAKGFLNTHTPQRAFHKYLTAIPEVVQDSVFLMRVPSYDVRVLTAERDAGAGISDYRLRAMQRGYLRMERLQSTMMWAAEMGDVLRNARSIAKNIDIPDACRATILNSNDKLLTYLFSNDGDDGDRLGGNGDGDGNGSGSVSAAVGGSGSNAMEDVEDATEVANSPGMSSSGHSASTVVASSSQ